MVPCLLILQLGRIRVNKQELHILHPLAGDVLTVYVNDDLFCPATFEELASTKSGEIWWRLEHNLTHIKGVYIPYTVANIQTHDQVLTVVFTDTTSYMFHRHTPALRYLIPTDSDQLDNLLGIEQYLIALPIPRKN